MVKILNIKISTSSPWNLLINCLFIVRILGDRCSCDDVPFECLSLYLRPHVSCARNTPDNGHTLIRGRSRAGLQKYLFCFLVFWLVRPIVIHRHLQQTRKEGFFFVIYFGFAQHLYTSVSSRTTPCIHNLWTPRKRKRMLLSLYALMRFFSKQNLFRDRPRQHR